MLALVNATGSGAYLGVQSVFGGETTLVCSWKTIPKLVHVQTVNFTAQVIGDSHNDTMPPVLGRAIWSTVRGMAEATRALQASLYVSSRELFDETRIGRLPAFPIRPNSKPVSQILEYFLADGAKATLAIWYSWMAADTRSSGVPKPALRCTSNNRTLSPHWRFHNKYYLGWLAAIWTILMGIYGAGAAVWMSKRRRMQGVNLLSAPETFVLGREEAIPDIDPLCVRDGRIVQK